MARLANPDPMNETNPEPDGPRAEASEPPVCDASPDAPSDAPASGAPVSGGPVLGAMTILTSIGTAVYQWTPGDDRLVWSANVTQVLSVGGLEAISTGKRFDRLRDPDTGESRHTVVLRSGSSDDGRGVAYQFRYALRPLGARGPLVWVEDAGRWFADSRGRPIRAQGSIRVLDPVSGRDRQLDHFSRCDALTGLLNRVHMLEAVEDAIDLCISRRTQAAFLIGAIDNLAVVNDAYGFEAADRMIAVVADRLGGHLRAGDAIGRLSGNKFGLLLRDCSEDEMDVAAMRFVACIGEEPICTDAHYFPASVTIGGVAIPRNARSAREALVHAHEALDGVRQYRRGGFRAYKPSKERTSERRRNVAIADEIVRGLNTDAFCLAYQPIVDATTRQPLFHEALIRLQRTDGSVMTGAEVVPVAEKLGLIQLIDQRALELALADLDACPEAKVSLNVSPRTVSDPAWLDQLGADIAKRPDLAERLVVELTEAAAIHNIEETCGFVAALRGKGVRVAIDDFGAGYTSFHNLKMLQADLLKIDGSFIPTLLESRENEVFVRSLIEIAQVFGMKTIAEWVGDEETALALAGMGIDLLQGELTGVAALQRPWPTSDDIR